MSCEADLDKFSYSASNHILVVLQEVIFKVHWKRHHMYLSMHLRNDLLSSVEHIEHIILTRIRALKAHSSRSTR